MGDNNSTGSRDTPGGLFANGVGNGTVKGQVDQLERQRALSVSSNVSGTSSASRQNKKRKGEDLSDVKGLDTEALKAEVDNKIAECRKKKDHKEKFETLFSVISTLCSAVVELGEENRQLRASSGQLSASYADVARKTAKVEQSTSDLKAKESRDSLANEIEECHRAVKIQNLELSCAPSKLKEQPKVIREMLSADPKVNNELRKASIRPFFVGSKAGKGEGNGKNGKAGKGDEPNKAKQVGAIIVCENQEKKKLLVSALKDGDQSFFSPYHWPKRIYNGIERIRSDFKKTHIPGADPGTAQLLIRPNQSFTQLNLRYRMTERDGWEYIGSVEATTYDANSGVVGGRNNRKLPHIGLFSRLEEKDRNPPSATHATAEITAEAAGASVGARAPTVQINGNGQDDSKN